MRRLKKSRRQLFEEIERAALKPLPVRPVRVAEWARPKVDPTTTSSTTTTSTASTTRSSGEQLDLRATEATVEIFRRGTRIESYPRSYAKGKYTTRKEHMPRAHLDQAEWTPERMTDWAKKTGPQTVALLEAIMASKAHPQQGFKACLGILRLGEAVPARAARAGRRAGAALPDAHSGSVAAMLEEQPRPAAAARRRAAAGSLPLHENIRGSGYYH